MDQYNAQSFWVSKKKGTIETEYLKKNLDHDELLIKTFYTGISYGTEKIVFNSQVPSNQFQYMKAPHQEGSFNTRVKYGYLNVGKVIDGPKDFINKMVYTMYPHQTKYIIKESLGTSNDSFPSKENEKIPSPPNHPEFLLNNLVHSSAGVTVYLLRLRILTLQTYFDKPRPINIQTFSGH